MESESARPNNWRNNDLTNSNSTQGIPQQEQVINLSQLIK